MQSLPIDCFSPGKAYRDGTRSQCKPCRVEAAASRLRDNPEKRMTPELRRAYAERRPPLTAERLRLLLDYDPSTGEFTRRIAAAKASKVGDKAGGVAPTGYSMISVDGGRYLAHRLAWLYVCGIWPVGEIDHVDGVRLNNRIGNLRDVDRRTNTQNLRKGQGKSGLLGSSFCAPLGKWRAQIRVPGVGTRHIGVFGSPEAAHAAYVDAKRLLHAGCTI